MADGPESVDLVELNEARRWWLDNNVPWTGHLPTDDEVLARWRAHGSPQQEAHHG